MARKQEKANRGTSSYLWTGPGSPPKMGKSSNSRSLRPQIQAPAGSPGFKFTQSQDLSLTPVSPSLQTLTPRYIQPLEGTTQIQVQAAPRGRGVRFPAPSKLSPDPNTVLLSLKTRKARRKGTWGEVLNPTGPGTHRCRRGNQENANPQDGLECRARGIIAKTALSGVEPFGQGLVEHQADHSGSGCR